MAVSKADLGATVVKIARTRRSGGLFEAKGNALEAVTLVLLALQTHLQEGDTVALGPFGSFRSNGPVVEFLPGAALRS